MKPLVTRSSRKIVASSFAGLLVAVAIACASAYWTGQLARPL